MSRTLSATAENQVLRRGAHDPDVALAFLDYLMERGLLDDMSSERAAQAQRQTGQRIDVVLNQLGMISDAALLEALSGFCSLPVAAAHDFPQQPVLEGILPFEFLQRSRIVPLAVTDYNLVVATTDPFGCDAIEAIGFLVERPVTAMLTSVRQLDDALSRLYGLSGSEERHKAIESDTRATVHEDDVQRLRDIASEAPIVRLVNRLIASAVGQRASDVHIEPMADCVRVRYRIDGVMEEVERLPPEVQGGVATRIKIVGKLNIAERRMPQDGRTTFVVGGREVDLRISTTPVLDGESIVLRILDKEQVDLSFEALGFDPTTHAALDRALSQPNGIILVTGPTGSGKTTTLYAALKKLNSIDCKVFSVEDPIEYQLPGINQMQIKPSIGLDFIHCLRAILRQDPDIIMIGEMRDLETTSTAIRASLTGHLVLSTLHTNSAAASITRLLDMGAEDYLLASSLLCVLAQRLVRRLCPQCAVPHPDGHHLYRQLVEQLADGAGRDANELRRPVGCAACRNSGFRGRTTIAEVLTIDDAVRRHVVRGTTDRDIERVARQGGMETLYQNGVRKVLAGETTVEEVLQVARF